MITDLKIERTFNPGTNEYEVRIIYQGKILKRLDFAELVDQQFCNPAALPEQVYQALLDADINDYSFEQVDQALQRK